VAVTFSHAVNTSVSSSDGGGDNDENGGGDEDGVKSASSLYNRQDRQTDRHAFIGDHNTHAFAYAQSHTFVFFVARSLSFAASLLFANRRFSYCMHTRDDDDKLNQSLNGMQLFPFTSC
jgi:hypothetical protein